MRRLTGDAFDRDLNCPRSHKHGKTSTCYGHHGCRCPSCLHWSSEYQRNRRASQGTDRRVPSGYTMRMLQALAVQGWSIAEVVKQGEISMNSRYLSTVRVGRREEVRRSTQDEIERAYALLAPHRNWEPRGKQVTSLARSHEWLGPEDWSDIANGRIRI